MKEPEHWDGTCRYNTCINLTCGHYLHNKECKVTGCKCTEGVGRFYHAPNEGGYVTQSNSDPKKDDRGKGNN